MDIKALWQEDIVISPYETDFQDEWKPASLVQAMQTIGNRHAIHLGFSMEALAAANQAWILARMKIRIFRMLKVDDTLKVQTFHKGIQQKIFFVRNARFIQSNGDVAAVGSTAWLVVDRSTRRILPGASLDTRQLPVVETSGLDEPLEKILVPDGMSPCGGCTATYNMTDVMGHVNNTRYVEWVTDCFSMEHYHRYRLTSLQINYANEVKPGEQIEFLKTTLPGEPTAWIIAGENTSSGKRSFESCLQFVDRLPGSF